MYSYTCLCRPRPAGSLWQLPTLFRDLARVEKMREGVEVVWKSMGRDEGKEKVDEDASRIFLLRFFPKYKIVDKPAVVTAVCVSSM